MFFPPKTHKPFDKVLNAFEKVAHGLIPYDTVGSPQSTTRYAFARRR